jgi:hypothetical protein
MVSKKKSAEGMGSGIGWFHPVISLDFHSKCSVRHLGHNYWHICFFLVHFIRICVQLEPSYNITSTCLYMWPVEIPTFLTQKPFCCPSSFYMVYLQARVTLKSGWIALSSQCKDSCTWSTLGERKKSQILPCDKMHHLLHFFIKVQQPLEMISSK